jgi:ribosomal protein S18 acetylase RimI-like enzyme
MINIRPLSNLELPKFLEFMDGPAFASQPQWAGCYCQTYLNRNGEELPAKQNRELACQRIASGVMQGYLAFEAEGPEEKVIGWMAANKNNNFAALPPSEESTATIICFVVDQSRQNQRVASKLLSFGLADLAERGYYRVQAAPIAENLHVDYGYRGKLSMFLREGFTKGPMLDDKHVLVTKEL